MQFKKSIRIKVNGYDIKEITWQGPLSSYMENGKAIFANNFASLYNYPMTRFEHKIFSDLLASGQTKEITELWEYSIEE